MKPLLRDETKVEKIYKKILRRFITLDVNAIKYAIYLSGINSSVYTDAKRYFVSMNSRKLILRKKVIARTPQEKLLKSIYKDVLILATCYAQLQFNRPVYSLTTLSYRCKEALYKTRRDMVL